MENHAAARITPCTVRNDAGRKTVMAFRTHTSSEPLPDRLGVVCTYLGCWLGDLLPRRRRNFVLNPNATRITPCTVINDVYVKTVRAFRAHVSSEPLSDRLGLL